MTAYKQESLADLERQLKERNALTAAGKSTNLNPGPADIFRPQSNPVAMSVEEMFWEMKRKSGEVADLKEKPGRTRNPKDIMGSAKLPLGSLPWAVIGEAALGLGEGMVKYGPHNWREADGVETMTYVEAAQRHLIAFVLGEDIDPHSGIHHISKAIASLMVIRDAQINGTDCDNRPAAVPKGFVEDLNAKWAEVQLKAQAAKVAAGL